jgi:hypothetical protein
LFCMCGWRNISAAGTTGWGRKRVDPFRDGTVVEGLRHRSPALAIKKIYQ